MSSEDGIDVGYLGSSVLPCVGPAVAVDPAVGPIVGADVGIGLGRRVGLAMRTDGLLVGFDDVGAFVVGAFDGGGVGCRDVGTCVYVERRFAFGNSQFAIILIVTIENLEVKCEMRDECQIRRLTDRIDGFKSNHSKLPLCHYLAK